MRLYIGVDESDSSCAVLAYDRDGEQVYRMEVKQSADSLSEFGGWLNAQVADGLELYASLERPHGRMVDFLLDHGVTVFPVNPRSSARVARIQSDLRGKRERTLSPEIPSPMIF